MGNKLTKLIFAVGIILAIFGFASEGNEVLAGTGIILIIASFILKHIRFLARLILFGAGGLLCVFGFAESFWYFVPALLCFGIAAALKKEPTPEEIEESNRKTLELAQRFANGDSPTLFSSRPKKESAADKWLRETKESQNREMDQWRANQRKKEQLLDQARVLEDQARYGTPWEQNQKRQQAENLRREANRL